jgi:uroporphyrinogen-III decarboxylase
MREHGDEYVIAGSSGMSVPMQEGWLEATALVPELVADYLDLQVERNLADIEAQHKAGIFIYNGGGDFAFKSGPIYSPKFFEKVMAPRWKRMFDRCRELGGYYVMRSDGDLWPVADKLFGWARPHAYYECDYDAGMRFADLRRAFPELVLMGNVSCALLLEGTPEQIRERTRECIEAAAPRVVAASANSILHGTPPENVYALYETARNYPVEKLRKERA